MVAFFVTVVQTREQEGTYSLSYLDAWEAVHVLNFWMLIVHLWSYFLSSLLIFFFLQIHCFI